MRITHQAAWCTSARADLQQAAVKVQVLFIVNSFPLPPSPKRASRFSTSPLRTCQRTPMGARRADSVGIKFLSHTGGQLAGGSF